MIRNIIFDYNGVISDDYTIVYNNVAKIFNHYGHEPLSIEDFREEFSIPFEPFYQKHLPEVDRSERESYYDSIYGESEKPVAYVGSVKLLKSLAERPVNMYILSSHTKKFIVEELIEFEINPNWFDEIVGGCRDKKIGLQRLIVDYSLNQEETVYIGDTPHDIRSGKDVNVKTIGTTYGYTTSHKINESSPDYSVGSPTELFDQLVRLID